MLAYYSFPFTDEGLWEHEVQATAADILPSQEHFELQPQYLGDHNTSIPTVIMMSE
jgi:hypothetical protein